ncbi:hypothetical protein PENTCL1PPCAC_29031 [Pristionchus entomophagus]|uniref:G protein-coupled receptor n=1 Tax=Pristionchus entomophagus TaxID=358040 RepID=A0AAV5UJR6_9BILA|nr:hypothetical protein PENTCL1PPCAC_29031 [Pristionchus entomophagus]
MASSIPFLPEMEDSLPKHEIPMDNCYSFSSSSTQDEIPPQRLTKSRRILIGPFSLILTLTGFDLQKSLCGNRDSRCRSVGGTTVFVIVLILFLIRALFVQSTTAPSLSLGWADTNIVGFTALQSFVALILLARWTATGMFSQVFTEILKVKRFYTDVPVTSIHEKPMFIFGLISGVVYVLVTLASSIKSSVYGRYSIEYNGTIVPLHPGYFIFSFDNLFGAEIILAIWMALCTVLATASYVYIHMAVSLELTKFNEDLNEAIEKNTLLDSLETFNIRHISILRLAVLLTDKLASYASFSTFTIVIANVNALYQISFIGSSNAFGTVMAILWMLTTSILLVMILNPPATIQQLVSHYLSPTIILIMLFSSNNQIALAQLMVTRNRITPTRMAIMNAIVVNTHTPHLITLIVPAVVAVLSYAKRFQQ